MTTRSRRLSGTADVPMTDAADGISDDLLHSKQPGDYDRY